MTTDYSGETSGGSAAKARRKKKGKTEDSKAIKKRISELEEENRMLKERITQEGLEEEEYEPDYSLLPKKRNLSTIEELREQIRFEPHYAIEGILVESANRIHSIANCSNNIRGDWCETCGYAPERCRRDLYN